MPYIILSIVTTMNNLYKIKLYQAIQGVINITIFVLFLNV